MFHTLQLPKRQCKDTRRQTRPGHFVHGVQFQGLLKILLGIPLAIGSGKLEPASSILFLSVGPAGELQSFRMIHTVTDTHPMRNRLAAHLIPSQASIPAEFGFYNSATAEINGPSWFQFQSCSVIIHRLGRAIHQTCMAMEGTRPSLRPPSHSFSLEQSSFGGGACGQCSCTFLEEQRAVEHL